MSSKALMRSHPVKSRLLSTLAGFLSETGINHCISVHVEGRINKSEYLQTFPGLKLLPKLRAFNKEKLCLNIEFRRFS